MDATQNTFSQNLNHYRKAKGFKQKELAAVLHISAAAVSSWETGTSTPHLETLYKICDVLDISISDLLGIEDHYSGDERALISAYQGHPEMQKAVKKVLEID